MIADSLFIATVVNYIFSTLQVVFWFEKLRTRKCSDKSTYLRAGKTRLGCGICPRISCFCGWENKFRFWVLADINL